VARFEEEAMRGVFRRAKVDPLVRIGEPSAPATGAASTGAGAATSAWSGGGLLVRVSGASFGRLMLSVAITAGTLWAVTLFLAPQCNAPPLPEAPLSVAPERPAAPEPAAPAPAATFEEAKPAEHRAPAPTARPAVQPAATGEAKERSRQQAPDWWRSLQESRTETAAPGVAPPGASSGPEPAGPKPEPGSGAIAAGAPPQPATGSSPRATRAEPYAATAAAAPVPPAAATLKAPAQPPPSTRSAKARQDDWRKRLEAGR
jgi:hypothetical protein